MSSALLRRSKSKPSSAVTSPPPASRAMLRNAFCIAHVYRLVAGYVVEVQRRWVGVESAVATSLRNLLRVEPAPNSCRTFVRDSIDALSVSRPRQANYAPRFGLVGIVQTLPWSVIGCLYFIWITFFPSARRSSRTFLAFNGCVHADILADCKPDIFEATYEAVPASPPSSAPAAPPAEPTT
jgi:hypothetical protein